MKEIIEKLTEIHRLAQLRENAAQRRFDKTGKTTKDLEKLESYEKITEQAWKELQSTIYLEREGRIDIESISNQIWGDHNSAFLSDGYHWQDKPHRVMKKALQEIIFLRGQLDL